MHLRKMCREDSSTVTRLSDQLGYPSSADEVLKRFDALMREPEQLVLLAEEDRAVIGSIHVLVVHRDIEPSSTFMLRICWPSSGVAAAIRCKQPRFALSNVAPLSRERR